MLITLSIIILILFHLIILISLKKLFFEQENKNSEVKISAGYVRISIVIAAKNEVNNIKTILEYLTKLDYEAENFEVIFVDDHSTDNTRDEIQKSISRLDNFRLISLLESEEGGKRNALAKGIESSRYKFILITDADCIPEQKWLIAFSKKFTKGFDFLFGIAPFNQNNSFINKIACFENLRSSILTLLFVGIGSPYSAAARNFGFTKSAFEKVKGYSNTKQTLSGDDDLLLREAVKNNLKIGSVTEKGSFVFSKTKQTLKEYLNQRARHTQSSAYYLPKHKLLLSIWHLSNLFSLLSIVLMLLNPFWGLLFAFKLLVDILIVKINDRKFGYDFNLSEIIILQILYELFLIVHFINSRFTKVKWK
ncbi:MAG: glycosyltransferase [Ignavibacteria bacterium]|nr:glycosyltransferase [Ignavibacteria bacterium]